MVKDLNQPRFSLLSDPWLIAVVTSALLLVTFAVGRNPEQSKHESVMTTLRSIDLNHASLQRDILQTRLGLLRSYDPLVASTVALRKLTTELNSLFMTTTFVSDERLSNLLIRLQHDILSDEILVEQFKTRNALLQNSAGVFSQTLTTLNQSQDEAIKQLMSEVIDLGNMIMRFSTKPDDNLAIEISRDLDLLLKSNKAGIRDITTLVTHARMIVKILPAVDSKILSVQGSVISDRTQQIQKLYLENYGKEAKRSTWGGIILGSSAISLCFYVSLLVYQLRNQAAILKRRLEYEELTSSVKSKIANSSSQFPELLRDALVHLSGFFQASSQKFAILDTETGEFKECCGFVEGKTELPPLFLEFAQSLKRNEISYRDLFRPNDLTYTRESTVSGILVGSLLSLQHAAVLLLEYESSRPEISFEELAMIQSSVQLLVEFVENNRSRQEKKALENRLEHAQRLEAVGALAGGIAHEFNNVLGAILGYGEMALQTLQNSPTTRQYVEAILTGGERAKHIVDQILTYSRKRDQANKPFDVAEAVNDILPLLQVTLGDKVTLVPSLANGPLVVAGNPLEMQQIIMNLCKNAVEASARGQEIGLHVSIAHVVATKILSHGELRPGNYVKLAVHDQGCGIPTSVLPHIFEPFFTTKHHRGGTGLGLSAVYGSVTRLAGCIDVKSNSVTGTTFQLFFPQCDQAAFPIDGFFNERTVPIGNGQAVIILEKDQSLLELYEEKIAALGYEPLGCSNFDAVLETLNADHTCPHLIIVDVGSLGNGLRTAEIDAIGELPVLFLLDRESDGKIAVPHPRHSETLRKPFSSHALAHAIFDQIQSSKHD
ncbi:MULTISPECIES: two-component system VirA-like sensor kinase [unclassified Phyllobacterium]|uniref:two-component system VirA-like sensor kinase n=1 Tax=unclassified Phyllobacterium TaxID=2638441 RepID=UPI003013150F